MNFYLGIYELQKLETAKWKVAEPLSNYPIKLFPCFSWNVIFNIGDAEILEEAW